MDYWILAARSLYIIYFTFYYIIDTRYLSSSPREVFIFHNYNFANFSCSFNCSLNWLQFHIVNFTSWKTNIQWAISARSLSNDTNLSSASLESEFVSLDQVHNPIPHEEFVFHNWVLNKEILDSISFST